MTDNTNAANLNESSLDIRASPLSELIPALARLDSLLEISIDNAQLVFGKKAAGDLYRGLYINKEEVERLLKREPGTPILSADENTMRLLPDGTQPGSRLDWLKNVFRLSIFDLDVLLLALAPELDRRYERLYAYLQDHVSHRRASVDLALNILCPNAAAKLGRREHFYPDAPLRGNGLIHLSPAPDHRQASLLAHQIIVDEQIVRLLLYQDGLDDRLAPFCKLMNTTALLEELPINHTMQFELQETAGRAWEDRQPLRLYFQGPDGAGKRQAAAALAAHAGTQLLVVDLELALHKPIDFGETLRLIFRLAWFQGIIPYFEHVDTLSQDGQFIKYRQLLNAIAGDEGITILSGTQAWRPTAQLSIGVLPVQFSMPAFEQRRACWQEKLTLAGITLEDGDLKTLAGRFRLFPRQIAEVVAICHSRNHRKAFNQTERLPGRPSSRETLESLFTFARSQSGHDLAALACQIDPIYTWGDIVLPEDALDQLREICLRVTRRQRVLHKWGFDRKLSLGKGCNALFAGPSGTGKTMAAEVIANELNLDLYKIDLAGVVSKYIGETEKNLDRIFTAAGNANAILFFDEADALFGKRSEVRDSHDRYANIEISYLLQKMEQFDGIAILATNLRGNLDQAFTRRLAFTVHFPLPDENSRLRIWTKIWPAQTPLAGDVELAYFARQFKLNGGNIKNIALAASFLAAEENGMVTTANLLQATRREYQKMGKVLSKEEFNDFHRAPQAVAKVA